MKAVVYYISLPFIYLVSVLPFPVLYGFSSFVYVVLYHLTGYRKKIIIQNLKNSFPQKTDKEIRYLARKFYRYFCDLFLETFKTLTISRKNMLRHCTMTPEALAVFTKYAAENNLNTQEAIERGMKNKDAEFREAGSSIYL
ncbi:MAG: lysophospholipid acyltransferase family protein [Flavobacteriales bacterium]